MLERKRFKAIIKLLFVFILLLGCSKVEPDEYTEKPAEVLYNEALGHLKEKKYKTAAKAFTEVERQHPYSIWALKSQLMSAYSSYMKNEYDDAILTLDRFIQLHPVSKDAPYAYYLKALCYYEQISDVKRDQQMTENAMKSLKDLIVRFPNSKYARDAEVKIDLTLDHLAGKEMQIGRYYQNKGNYLAAINRFLLVTKNYQKTTHVAEALHRLTETYTALGMMEEAKKAAAVLGFNFPGNEWYYDSYGLVGGKKGDLERAKNSKWFWPFTNDKESIQKEDKVKIESRVKVKTDNKTKWYWPFAEEKESSETEKQVKIEGKKKSKWYWPFD